MVKEQTNQLSDIPLTPFQDQDEEYQIKRENAIENLIEATKIGDLETLRQVCADVSPDVRGFMGWTPAHWAAREGHIPILGYLNVIGANLFALDDKGENLLHKAAANGQVETAKWLLKHGLNVHLTNNNGLTPFHLAREAATLRPSDSSAVQCARLLLDEATSTF